MIYLDAALRRQIRGSAMERFGRKDTLPYLRFVLESFIGRAEGWVFDFLHAQSHEIRAG